MRVVVDTNVLVSAVWRDRNPQDVLLFLIDTPDFEWVVSREILQEYKTVLARKKFNLSEPLLTEWFSLIDDTVEVIPVDIQVGFPRDLKDAKFLACALSADADWLITGDKDFDAAEKVGETTIISVSMFKRIVMADWK
ncbi:MAG: putative toxin-antitoxin system toxin component, PIN family [Chloroflexota bacterium]